MNNNDCRLINEYLVAIDKVLNCDFLQAHDRILLEKTYRYGNDAVNERLNYFSNYYYSYENIAKGDIDSQQSALFQINVNTATMFTTILGFRRNICGIGGSTHDYYIARMDRVIWSLEHILEKNLTEIYLPSLYVLINLTQSLTEYLLSTDQQYRDSALKILKKVNDLTERFAKTEAGQEILVVAQSKESATDKL